jgi:Negative regulator of sigma F
MNCDDFREWLARGEPITGPAMDHIRTCAGCRAMLDALDSADQMPDTKHLALIREQIAGTLTPVRPLPSDTRMVGVGLSMFVLFSLLLTIPVGYRGFERLDELQRVLDYVTILILACLFSLATVQEIIPGSRRRIHPATPLVASLILLPLLTIGLFPNFDLARFVQRGLPCLRLGTISAFISGAIGYWFVDKGYASSPGRLGAIFGSFAGLAGVAVLALHCGILNAAHIIVWHFGAMLLSGVTGSLIGHLSLRSIGKRSLSNAAL